MAQYITKVLYDSTSNIITYDTMIKYILQW